ncbi:ComEC/Rec2 family competence protein [Larkinella rosea]|uniref:MBL fold metallo-hydrolase n=1 Tax=Larkinella rosea TaxID=2025312 RepID=A0A3P1BMW3_9BACT|nr:MBL fold metallo-hydrolase [Larkinella rosea]RRB02480.1 MBL fold metallo-hydrolase [Larkinella rosea]
MVFRMIQAEFGDCLILETPDTDGTIRYILVDGGPEGTYDHHLSAELDAIRQKGGQLDLVVLSHVDGDHIVGLLDLFSELLVRPQIQVAQLWLNSFDKAIGQNNAIATRVSEVFHQAGMQGVQMANTEEVTIQSINQGNKLRTRAQQLHIPINPGIPDGLIKAAAKPQKVKIGGITFTVVGPTTQNLKELQKEWQKWLDKQDDALASSDLESFAMADESIPNLSSICLLAESNGVRILLTGDARGDHLLQGLKQAKLLQPDGSIDVDVLKVPHHGSDRNVTLDFFRKVRAKQYVISANGKYGNPDYDVLKWIVTAATVQQRPIELVISNDIPTVQQFIQDFPMNQNTYTVRFMPKDDHSMVV